LRIQPNIGEKQNIMNMIEKLNLKITNEKWRKTRYNKDGLEISYEDSDKYWRKTEYNDAGLEIRFEDSDKRWYKKEYDKDNLEIKYEGSDGKRKIKLIIE